MDNVIQEINNEMVPHKKPHKRRSLVVTDKWKTIFSGTNTKPTKKTVTFQQRIGLEGDDRMVTTETVKEYFKDLSEWNDIPETVWNFEMQSKDCKVIIPPYSRVEAAQLVGKVQLPEMTLEVFTTRLKLRTRKL